MKHSLILLILLHVAPLAWGQRDLQEMVARDIEVPDSVDMFSLDNLYLMLLTNHPVVKQAELLPQNAQQEIRMARGAFDPKLEANWDWKQFKGTEYYNILSTQVKIPVWFPIDPKVGLDRNTGTFLNPERAIPNETNNQQFFIGFSIPIGKGLFIDERRTAVKQAEIYTNVAEAERIKMVNKVLLEAAKDYWTWFNDYYRYILQYESLELAQEIFRRVKLDYEYGEASVVDTVQAEITYGNRLIELQDAEINLVRSRLTISNYLWNEDGQPVILEDHVVPLLLDSLPPIPDPSILRELKIVAQNQHPELMKLDFKVEQLLVENRWNKEQLKPQLDLEYAFLDQPINSNGEGNGFNFSDNYKLGLDFSFPIFLRKERSKIKKTELKILDTQYERTLRKRQIFNDLDAIYTELSISHGLIDQQFNMIDGYRRLLQAEIANLDLGESDLFRINFQQDNLIQSQTKLVKMFTNMEKARATLYWAAGVQTLNFQP